MEARKCERCGAYYDNPANGLIIKSYGGFGHPDHLSAEICANCRFYFEQWWEQWWKRVRVSEQEKMNEYKSKTA